MSIQKRADGTDWTGETALAAVVSAKPYQQLASILYEMKLWQGETDIEITHSTADGLLIMALKRIAETHPEGATILAIVDAWDKVDKWYA